MFTLNELSALATAQAMVKSANELLSQADDMLEPVAKSFMHRILMPREDDTRAYLLAMVEHFPPGFYRTELRAAVYMKFPV